MVAALALGASAFGREGSNPFSCTKYADVVELVDTLALEVSSREGVRVQVSPSAPI